MSTSDFPAPGSRVSQSLAEAERLMTVCNSCRYCEGLCAVFPAMEMRRSFAAGDLEYLANLCHGCGACYVDCQFSPPHQFNVNVPKVLAEVRGDSYQTHAWPQALAPLFEHNGLAVGLSAAGAITAFVIGFVALNDPGALLARRTGPGAFYAMMPHSVMALLFGAAFLYAVVAITLSARNFWRAIGPSPRDARTAPSLWRAMQDAGRLRYLDGGGAGCDADTDAMPDRRRLFHHLTMYGFLLCFAATSVGTLYHYVFSREAPYPWYDLPVVLGSLGGLGLLIGPAGLVYARKSRDAALTSDSHAGLDNAFTVLLFASSLTGFGLLLARSTQWLGPLLALHLGVVLALFLTLPYSKFVHGIYRFLALVRAAQERQTER